MCVWMFYEILQDGFHTPLTATQIGELFQAGHVGRHTRCKPAKQSEWLTIDELFPLLKHHTASQLVCQAPEPAASFKLEWSSAVAVSVSGAAAIAAIIYFSFHIWSSQDRRTTAIDSSTDTITPSMVAPVERTNPQAAIRLAEEQRIAQQARHDQAIADRARVVQTRP